MTRYKPTGIRLHVQKFVRSSKISISRLFRVNFVDRTHDKYRLVLTDGFEEDSGKTVSGDRRIRRTLRNIEPKTATSPVDPNER